MLVILLSMVSCKKDAFNDTSNTSSQKEKTTTEPIPNELALTLDNYADYLDITGSMRNIGYKDYDLYISGYSGVNFLCDFCGNPHYKYKNVIIELEITIIFPSSMFYDGEVDKELARKKITIPLNLAGNGHGSIDIYHGLQGSDIDDRMVYSDPKLFTHYQITNISGTVEEY